MKKVTLILIGCGLVGILLGGCGLSERAKQCLFPQHWECPPLIEENVGVSTVPRQSNLHHLG